VVEVQEEHAEENADETEVEGELEIGELKDNQGRNK